MSDESHKDTLHFLDTHIYMLDHTSIEHPRWYMPTIALLLQFLEAPENDSFTMDETVSNIWQIITRITAWHVRFSPWHHVRMGISRN
jgi:hypothetical protein